MADNPFSREAIVRVGPDGRVYHAWTNTLGVRITTIDGWRAGFALRAEGGEVTDDVERVIDTFWPQRTVLRAPLEAAVPERWPVLRNLVVDDRSRAWLWARRAAGTAVGVAGVPPGRPHRRPAVLPPGTDVMRVEGERLYAVQTDELDVPRLVGYRVDGLR